MRGAGSVLGQGRWLVDAARAGPSHDAKGRDDGVQAAPDRFPLTLHSDRGTQFTSADYQQFLQDHQIGSSMSAVRYCGDNAAMEGVFGLLRRERVNRRRYLTLAEARVDVVGYIERFHNPRMQRRLDAEEQAFIL